MKWNSFRTSFIDAYRTFGGRYRQVPAATRKKDESSRSVVCPDFDRRWATPHIGSARSGSEIRPKASGMFALHTACLGRSKQTRYREGRRVSAAAGDPRAAASTPWTKSPSEAPAGGGHRAASRCSRFRPSGQERPPRRDGSFIKPRQPRPRPVFKLLNCVPPAANMPLMRGLIMDGTQTSGTVH